MRSRTRLGFALTVGATVLLFIGWIIPFWFGRFYGNYSKTQWSLFYRIQCITGRCETIGGILSNEIVNFEGGDQRIELEAVAILATMGLALCLLSLGIVLFFHCSLCGKSFSYFNYIFGASIVQFVSAVFVFLTIVIAGIAVGDFLSVRRMDSVIEFPWAILFYSFGLILLIASAIIFILIVIQWKKYRHIYAKKRYYFNRNGHAPNIADPKSELYRVRTNSHDRHRDTRRQYFSDSNLFGVDNSSYNGSLRYKFDPKREKYVGFLTDTRNDKPYATLPTRGSKYKERARVHYSPISQRDMNKARRANIGHSSPISERNRYPSGSSWHSKIDDVLRESYRFRMTNSNFQYADAYI